jgi:hypothetical protein
MPHGGAAVLALQAHVLGTDTSTGNEEASERTVAAVSAPPAS